ncbi:MAG: Stf0 family sulfotransferase [Alphaproteobacteria bacterium]
MSPSKISIPEYDFVDARYDQGSSSPTTNLLIIFSTPRSGSTYLCDLLLHNEACIAHEYFQPYHYMKILSERWDAPIQNGDLSNYVEKLKQYRTFPNGCLGINLHGEHLPVYLRAEKYFAALDVTYVHVVRRDQIAQAVSFHIAMQTRQWSSRYKSDRDPSYNYHLIRRRLEHISNGNNAISAFLRLRNADAVTIVYEDLIADPAKELARLPLQVSSVSTKKIGLKRQTNQINEQFAKKFSQQHISGMPEFKQFGTAKPWPWHKVDTWARRHIPAYWRLST